MPEIPDTPECTDTLESFQKCRGIIFMRKVASKKYIALIAFVIVLCIAVCGCERDKITAEKRNEMVTPSLAPVKSGTVAPSVAPEKNEEQLKNAHMPDDVVDCFIDKSDYSKYVIGAVKIQSEKRVIELIQGAFGFEERAYITNAEIPEGVDLGDVVAVCYNDDIIWKRNIASYTAPAYGEIGECCIYPIEGNCAIAEKIVPADEFTVNDGESIKEMSVRLIDSGGVELTIPTSCIIKKNPDEGIKVGERVRIAFNREDMSITGCEVFK
ncbi:MAG: hypothetical protein K5848_00305 [Lachnospiraceae bacterium]|nr:hypothetical protein [Lachnospiraceae bacterium]